ncbi:MAG: hypothetical protein ABSG46_20600 [Candidatus Binataceae bacterium]|jgi:hypothetical protein
MEHKSSDGHAIEVGKKFWNNDLRVCEITEVASWSNEYADTGCTQTWHDTNKGHFDTLDGSMKPYGRLARYYGGKDAERYEAGTYYGDISGLPNPL